MRRAEAWLKPSVNLFCGFEDFGGHEEILSLCGVILDLRCGVREEKRRDFFKNLIFKIFIFQAKFIWTFILLGWWAFKGRGLHFLLEEAICSSNWAQDVAGTAASSLPLFWSLLAGWSSATATSRAFMCSSGEQRVHLWRTRFGQCFQWKWYFHGWCL